MGEIRTLFAAEVQCQFMKSFSLFGASNLAAKRNDEMFWMQLLMRSETRYYSKGTIIADSREEAKGLIVITSGQVYWLMFLCFSWSAKFHFDCSMPIRLVQKFLWIPTMQMPKTKARVETPSCLSLSEGTSLFSRSNGPFISSNCVACTKLFLFAGKITR